MFNANATMIQNALCHATGVGDGAVSVAGERLTFEEIGETNLYQGFQVYLP